MLEGVNINVWVPLTKKNNSWLDIKTGNKLSKPGNWIPGFPVNDSNQICALFPLSAGGIANFRCEQTGALGGYLCACHFRSSQIGRS